MAARARVPVLDAQRLVLEEVLRHGPLTRSDIARRLRMTNARLSQVSTVLLERGLLAEADQSRVAPSSAVGRPGQPLEVVPSLSSFVGTWLGESVVTSCLTNLRAEIIDTVETRLTGHTEDEVTAVIADQVARLGAGHDPVAGLGVCLAGQVDADGLVRRAPFLGWQGVPLGPELARLTGIGVQVDNDLTGLTQAEHWFGVGKEYDQFAVLSLGAGIGLGVVAGDRRIDGPDQQGHRGCARAMLSLGCVEAALSQGRGRATTFADGLTLAGDGDPVARRVFTDGAAALGRLLAMVANIALPDAIVVTGEAAGLALRYRDQVERTLAEYRHALARPVPLVIRTIDRARWARGAAARAIQQFAFHADL
jgi:predicted NBD/HSP70 family sugar kinase